MNEKILYSYNKNGDIEEYTVYVKLNIRSGFEISDSNKREMMLHHLESNYIRSKIYPDTILQSQKPFPRNQLYFERKDICKALKGNSCITKFSNPNKIITFLNMIETKSTDYLNYIKEYNTRIQECIKKSLEYACIIVDNDFSPINIELSEILLNLKNICIYLIDDVVDGIIDTLYTVKQLQVSFVYDIETETNSNKSILVLMNDLIELEKRMKENEVAILFKKISTTDFKNENIDEKLEEILELPEEEIYSKLQEYIMNETESDTETDNKKNPNVVIICDDEESPKLSIKKNSRILRRRINEN